MKEVMSINKLSVRGSVAVMVALVLMLVAVTSSFAGEKASRGLLSDEMVSNAASHFLAAGGDGSNAGAIVSSMGKIEGLGVVTVDVSSSWDWGLYDGVTHPCALMNITPHNFLAGNLPGPVPFTTNSTVMITTKNGDEIHANIVGGSVCELSFFFCPATGFVATINEGLTSFKITGGTGKFATATGTGLLRSVFNFCTGVFQADEIFLHLD